MNPLQSDSKKIIKLFKKERRKILTATALTLLSVFGALAIVGMQFLYPYHIMLGFGLWIISSLFFVRRLYLGRKHLRKYRTFVLAKKFVQYEKYKIIAALVILFCVLVYVTVRPFGNDSFEELSSQELESKITEDIYIAAGAMDYLETTGNELIEALRTEREDAQAADVIRSAWSSFITAVAYSEVVTDEHRFFHEIPYKNEKERDTSFLIAYSLYVKKYEILHRVFTAVGKSEFERKILNEEVVDIKKSNIYNEMVERYYQPKTRIRLTGGRVYLALFGDQPEMAYEGTYGFLLHRAEESYAYLLLHFDTTVARSGTVLTEAARSRMFEQWFPIQRSVANTMGHVILSERGKEGLIHEEDIAAMRTHMLPGDFMLQRRNWHLSNVGIPGFWTHAALYTGSLEDMDTYFASEFPFEGYKSMSAYIQEKFPDVYQKYTSSAPEVIEAIEPGVVMQTLAVSANADYVVVLRPNLSKRDVMLALFRAMRHVGKPYDYNFDFDTKDSLVCSELVYDAYADLPTIKKGMNVENSIVNGRKIVSPLDIAHKFKDEYGKPGAQFQFVYLIESDEKTSNAFPSTVDRFIESISWDKFSFTKDHVREASESN